jgi:hypothetical protein
MDEVLSWQCVFFLMNSFHVDCPIPAMGRGTKKMAIIITMSREHLAKSG